MESPVRPLGASVARLHELVGGLDVDQLDSPSYSSGWSIADVLSHLGSSAVLLRRRLADARAGVQTTLDAQPIRDEWNAKTPRAKADDALVEDERVLEDIEAVGREEWDRLTFDFGPVTVGLNATVALRLNEHAFHTWDIEVMFDDEARLPPDAAAVIVDNLGLIARFTARPTGDVREVWVRTSHPERHFTVRLTTDAAELLEGDAGEQPDVELPAEAFCRLVYGRLDADHSPAVEANGEVLDTLRRVFPGP
jgi:uncharacterized protein (TIGR03083 family)